MPQFIQLEPLPNQNFTLRLDDHRYDITLKSISDDLMCISIMRDNIMLIQSVRAMPSTLFLPEHMEMGLGNFAFITVSDEYPNYQKFGADHQLYYYQTGEV